MPADQMTMLDDLAEILRSGLEYEQSNQEIVERMLARLGNPTPQMIEALWQAMIASAAWSSFWSVKDAEILVRAVLKALPDAAMLAKASGQ